MISLGLGLVLGLVAGTLLGGVSTDNGCTNPGQYQCAVVLYSSSFDFPDPFHWDESESYYAHVVDGNCNQIDTSGSLQPLGSGNGFSANLQTSYNTEVDVYASEVSPHDHIAVPPILKLILRIRWERIQSRVLP
jgi:hypothetical protein